MSTLVTIENSHQNGWDCHISRMDRTPATEGFPGSITNHLLGPGEVINFALGPNEKLIVQPVPHDPAKFIGEKL